jgi:protein gp37
MGANSAIEWTDHTINFWWGCLKVSPGCTNCYAETFSKRVGRNIWGPAQTTERWRTKGPWADCLKWDQKAKAEGVRRKVFCQSMSDFFEDHPQLPAWRTEAFEIIESFEWLDVQLLTKRIENVLEMVPQRWLDNWPAHVWMGTSVENQEYADKRIPELLKIPAKVRFLSMEPLLGPVDLNDYLFTGDLTDGNEYKREREQSLSSSYRGGVGDRRSGAGLEGCSPSREQVDWRNGTDEVQQETGGTRSGRISSSESNVQREEGACFGASVGVQALLWTDPQRDDGKSQEWGQEGQQAQQPGDSNVLRTGLARQKGFEKGETRPIWGEERHGKVNPPASERNSPEESYGREVGPTGEGLRRHISGGFQDSSRRQVAAISWTIIGGESGPGARVFELDWATSIINQCKVASVAVFMKQLGSKPVVDCYGYKTLDKKGGDPDEWPEELRVREFPATEWVMA